MRTRSARPLYASIIFCLCTVPGVGSAATVHIPFNNLATGISDLNFQGQSLEIFFQFTALAGNEALFPTLGDPAAGAALVIAINAALQDAGATGVLPNGVYAADSRYEIPGEIIPSSIGPLVANPQQGRSTAEGWILVQTGGQWKTTAATTYATVTNIAAVPIPATGWLIATAVGLLASRVKRGHATT